MPTTISSNSVLRQGSLRIKHGVPPDLVAIGLSTASSAVSSSLQTTSMTSKRGKSSGFDATKRSRSDRSYKNHP